LALTPSLTRPALPRDSPFAPFSIFRSSIAAGLPMERGQRIAPRAGARARSVGSVLDGVARWPTGTEIHGPQLRQPAACAHRPGPAARVAVAGAGAGNRPGHRWRPLLAAPRLLH